MPADLAPLKPKQLKQLPGYAGFAGLFVFSEAAKCDNCLIGFMIFMQYLSCICRLAACISGNDELDAMADAVECVADLTYCSVCACMQTQHHEQLNFRDNNPGAVKVALGVPPVPLYAPPPQQGGMQRGAPPAQGYPAQGYPQNTSGPIRY